MKKCINKVTIEGYVYQHTLAVKTVQNQSSANYGKEFINGQIDIVVDEEGLNIIPVRYTYVTATTNAGTENRTYTALKNIIENGKTWLEYGKEATKVKCDTSFALNDFYNANNELVSQMVQEGGFVTILSNFDLPVAKRSQFVIDFLLTNVARIDADPEKNIENDYCTLRGACFNFRNAILPMTFVIKDPKGMDYFESLDANGSEPVFTKLFGVINHTNIKVNKEEESAFGESIVSTFDRKLKEWIVVNAAKEPYDFGDEEVLTAEEVTKALQDREVYLAETKKKTEESRNAKATVGPAVVPTTPASSSAATPNPAFKFNF